MRNPRHSILQNNIAATQPPITQSLIRHGLHRENPPALITSSSLAIMKCSCFIPVLGKAKSPCTSRIFLQRGGNPLVVLRSLLRIHQLLLQTATASARDHWWSLTKLHLSFCTHYYSTPSGRHQWTSWSSTKPCTGGYQLHLSHGGITSTVPGCSTLTKARHLSWFEIKML